MDKGVGAGIGIDLSKLSAAIVAADNKMKELAVTAKATASVIKSEFRDAAASVGTLASSIEAISKNMSSLNNVKIGGVFSQVEHGAQGAMNSTTSLVAAIQRLLSAQASTGKSSGLSVFQTQLDNIFNRIEKLRAEMTTFQQWQSGNLLNTNDWKHISGVTDEINKQMNAYAALEQAQRTLSQEQPFRQQIDKLSRQGLDAQRYKDTMADMRRFYEEEEKNAERAAEKRVQEEKEANDKIERDRKRLERNQRRLAQEQLRKYNTSYEGATKYSDSAQTLAQDRVAIERLTAARERLNRADANYKNQLNDINSRIRKHSDNIKRATKDSQDFKKEQESIFSASGRWIKRMALMYGVHQISNFVRKLVEVRGEFELQHRSLQVLLQNKDKADEIWNKTVQLAVKSPFRVKELVTYTKQLAAYRIESDKLYETNKMLADVSAGLGVDMNRLILAYGQVKAASYLRGTELRQFSEAGIPMLEELAKRFSELEGRAVSVGDVFNRISKRMVTFADVDAVFKKITSEGGVFYNMQEKQAETLKGMMSNLSDSIDLMFNEIGKNGDSTLKGIVRVLKSIVENWRVIGSIIKVVGITLMTYFGVKALTAIGKGIANIKTAFTNNPWTMALTTIALVASAIWEVVTAQNAVVAAMNQIDIDVRKDLEEHIALYQKLADTINDVTATNEERAKAYEDLKSAFEQILPKQYLELSYIEDLSGAYEEARNSMFQYYNTKAIEQKKAKIEEMYSEKLYGTNIPNVVESIRSSIEDEIEDERLKTILLSAVSGAVNETVEAVKNGSIDVNGIWRAIYNKLLVFVGSGEGMDYEELISSDLIAQITYLRETLIEYLKSSSYIEGLPSETHAEGVISDTLTTEKGKIEHVTKAFKTAAKLYEKYILATATETESLETVRKKIQEDVNTVLQRVPQAAQSYVPVLQTAFAKMKEAADKGMFDFRASLRNIESEMYLEDGGIAGTFERLMTLISVRVAKTENIDYEEVLKAADATKRAFESTGAQIDMSNWEESIISGAREIAEKFGHDVDIFKDFVPQQGEGLDQLRKKVSGQIERYNEDIKRMQTSLKQGMYTLSAEVLQTTQADIDRMKSELPALIAYLQFLGEEPKEKKGGRNPMEDRIRVIKELHKSYKELQKTLSDTEAMEGAFAKYKDAFGEAYKGTSLLPRNFGRMTAEQFLQEFNFTTEDGVTEFFNNLVGLAKDTKDRVKVELAKGEFVMEGRLEVEERAFTALMDKVDKKIKNYEFSLEFKNLNLSEDLAKVLFDVDFISLDELKNNIIEELSLGREDLKEKLGKEELSADDWLEISKIIGTDEVKEYKRKLNTIDDMEKKAQVERLKTYLKYAQIAIGEKAKIKVEEINKLKEIEDTFNKESAKATREEDKKLIEQQRQKAILGVQKEVKEKESKYDWNEFKSSETFVSLFQDLDKASNTLVNHAISKLREFREQWQDMPVTEAKEMITKLNQLEMKLMDTGKPFEDYRKSVEFLEQAMARRGIDGKKMSGYAALNDAIASENIEYEKQLETSNKIITTLNTINSITTKTKQEDLARVGINEEYVKQLGLGAEVLTNTIEANNEIIDSEKSKKVLAQDNLSINNRTIMVLKSQSVKLKAQEQAYSQIKDMAHDLYDAFKGVAEALEADMESPAAIFSDMGMSMMDTVLNTLMLQVQLKAVQVELSLATATATGFGAAMNAALGVIGWIVMGIQLLTAAISAIVKAQDKDIDEQVEAYKKQIEQLEERYDKLSDSISDVYDTTKLKQVGDELDKIYEKEKKAIELAITARESDSKISDEERDEIDELKKSLLELEDTYKESMKDIFSHATDGILDSVYDAAKEFTDAWYDAFKETGDGLSGLQENFNEMFMNLAKNQAAMLITSAYVERWKESLGQYINKDDTEPTREEALAWAEEVKASFPALNEALEAFLGTLHESLDTTGSLSELQKGIQGITEDTAQVLESLLNSMRFYVADSNSQIKQQTQYMRDIYNMLSSLTTISSNDGIGFKVVMV